jgi:hypothetical protein
MGCFAGLIPWIVIGISIAAARSAPDSVPIQVQHSHRVTSQRVKRHHITSHHITFHYITSYHITSPSHHITSLYLYLYLYFKSHHIRLHHVNAPHASDHVASHNLAHIVLCRTAFRRVTIGAVTAQDFVFVIYGIIIAFYVFFSIVFLLSMTNIGPWGDYYNTEVRAFRV